MAELRGMFNGRADLSAAIAARGSYLCVGLDPDPQRIPASCGSGVAGMEAFCRDAAAAGAAGLVVPDLPLEEAEKLSAIAAEQALDLVLLVAPTTPADRMQRIAAASRGFTYLVSVTGVTGVRTNLESRVAGLVQQLKGMGPTPVAVGFGISGPEQARQVRDWGADGAIVGSALVKVMAEAHCQQGDVAAAAGRFCGQLRAALDA